jgi:hypothetical protein
MVCCPPFRTGRPDEPTGIIWHVRPRPASAYLAPANVVHGDLAAVIENEQEHPRNLEQRTRERTGGERSDRTARSRHFNVFGNPLARSVRILDSLPEPSFVLKVGQKH